MQPSRNNDELSAFSQSLLAVVNRFDDTLWIPGLALFVLTGVWMTVSSVPARQEEVVRILYVSLGLIFPLVIFLRRSKGKEDGLGNWRVLISLFFIASLASIGIVLLRSSWAFLPAALESILIFVILRRRGQLVDAFHNRETYLSGLVAVLAIMTCWAVDITVVWWEDWSDVFRHSPFAIFVLLCAVLFATSWVFIPSFSNRPRPWDRFVDTVLTGGSILVFALASFRPFTLATPPFDMTFGTHHWGVYIGPAQMVRDGGYLLWDVPSQYGFLSELLPAMLPLHSVWQSFYVLESLSQLAGAVLFYVLLRQQRTGLFNSLFAFALVLAAVFLAPGGSSGLFGPQTWPSYTAYRYGLLYAMLAIAYITSRQNCTIKRFSGGLAGGCLVWCVSCFWSAEVAAWCTSLWLPMFGHLLYRKWKAEEVLGCSIKRRARRMMFWIALHFAMIAGALLTVEWVYRLKLGHGPDWGCYFDYIRAANSGSFESHVPLQYAVTGYFWIPLIVLIGMIIVGSKAVQRNLANGYLTLLVAAFVFVWATNSYTLALVQPRTMEVSGELISLIGGTVILAILLDRSFTGIWPAVLKACLTPLIVIELVLAYGSFNSLQSWTRQTMAHPVSNIDHILPAAPPSLVRLMNTAGIRPADSVVYLDHLAMPIVYSSDHTTREEWGSTWLPVTPCALIGPLQANRLRIYMDRFSSRTKRAGWLIEPLHRSADNDALQAKVLSQMPPQFLPIKSFGNQNYRIVLYVYRVTSTSKS